MTSNLFETRKPKSRARGPRTRGKKKEVDGGSKVGDWFVKAGKYIKDNKIVSKSLKAVSPFLGAYGGLTTAASAVAESAGYGLSVPGGGICSTCKCRCSKSESRPVIQPQPVIQPDMQPRMRAKQGTGLSLGSGLTLAGDRYQPLRRRIVPADCSEEVRGTGRIIGNRVY